jgi:hypothetical protein
VDLQVNRKRSGSAGEHEEKLTLQEELEQQGIIMTWAKKRVRGCPIGAFCSVRGCPIGAFCSVRGCPIGAFCSVRGCPIGAFCISNKPKAIANKHISVV